MKKQFYLEKNKVYNFKKKFNLKHKLKIRIQKNNSLEVFISKKYGWEEWLAPNIVWPYTQTQIWEELNLILKNHKKIIDFIKKGVTNEV